MTACSLPRLTLALKVNSLPHDEKVSSSGSAMVKPQNITGIVLLNFIKKDYDPGGS
jgi:hypothetical protein